MSGEAPQLLAPDTDYLLDKDKAAMGTVLTAYRGGDPLRDPPAFGYPEHMQTEIERRVLLEGHRTQQMNEAIFTNPNSGWGQIKQFMDGVFDQYKTANQAQLIKKPKDQQEAVAQMQQMRPVQVDPNAVANIRQLATKLDAQMKAIDPRTSFWTDPRTKGYADWLNREAGPGTAGFMASGEQPVEMGVIGRTAYSAWQGIEGLASAPLSMIHGAWDLGRRSVLAMGGPDIGPSYPTNFMESNGEVAHNGGKVPSMMDGIAMMWGAATNQNIEQFANDSQRAQQWEQANRAGFGGLVTSVSRLGGELVGMAPGFGAAAKIGEMAIGGLSMKGLQMLGTLRLAKGVADSERALKIIGAMSKGIGQAAGMAGYESLTSGRTEGYAASYMHGLAMAPVLMTLGALGKKTEWFAANRASMPAPAARLVAGALEGAGFAGVETLAPNLLPSTWGFIRDPNQDTWETFAKNMLAFGLVKMASGRTTGVPPEVTAFNRGVGRAQFAEKVARGEATPEEIASAPVPDEGKLRELGELSQRVRAGDTAAQEKQRQVESELDVAEFGKGPAEQAVEEYKGPGKAEAKLPTQDEIAAVKDLPNGPEKRRRTIEMLKNANRAFGKISSKALEDVSKLELKKQEKDLENLKELVDAGDIQQSMVKGIDIGAMKSARRRALAEMQQREVEQVPGKEPQPMKPVADKPPPEKQLLQEGGREGLEPEKPAPPDRGKERAPRPLTPEQELLQGAEKAKAEASVPRGTPAELEARAGDRRTPSGERAGPQSLQQQPHKQVEPSPGVKQVSARDIYAEMEGRPSTKGFRIPFTSIRIGGSEGDFVKVPMRSGKVPGRRTLGVFKLFENLVRTKEGRDLAVAAHEWSHAMQRHALGARGNELAAKTKKEVEALMKRPDGLAIASEMDTMLKDYQGSQNMPRWIKWAETWAEWHARNLLGEVGLDAKFPALSSYMRSFLAAPGNARLGIQYRRIQEMLYRYNAQGAVGRVRQSRVSGAAPATETEKATKPGLVRRIITAANKALLDDMAELKESQDKWLKAVGKSPADVSIMDDPARMFDTLRMTANKTVEHFINRGIKLPGGQMVPGLKSVMDSVKARSEAFQDYVISVRSLDLYKRGKEVQLPIQDYIETIKQHELANPDFPKQLENLKHWTDALVDYVAGAGNISAEDAKKIKDAYVVYVPFFRAIEGPKQHGQGRGVAERGTGLSRIKGSTFEIEDPFIALQQVARSMVAKAHQNQVMTSLYNMAATRDVGALATIVKRTAVPTDHPLRELLDAIERQVDLPPAMEGLMEGAFDALKQADALNPQTVTLFSQKVIPTGERSVIAFTPRLSKDEIRRLIKSGGEPRSLLKQNNKLQWMEVDTKVYEALMGIDKMPQLPEAMQPVMQWLQAPRDVVRFFATGVAPGFVAANLIRDALSAPLFDRAGAFRPFGGFVKMIRGAIEYHKNGAMRELYEELGVKTSSFWTEGRQRELIGEQVSLWQRAKAFADTVQHWFSHPENYIRMAEFKDAYDAAKASGKGEREARLEALEAGREITVNFARAGVWARVMNQVIPYFNAGLQGQRKLWGQLVAGGADTKGDENKARVQRGAVLNAIANITVPATLLWLMNKDQDWYQDLPDWRKINYFNIKIGGQIISVPKPFEAGVVFASLPEMMLDHNFGHNPASMKQALSSIAGPYLQVGNLIPAFIKPIAEVAFNKNLFTGRPLTPEWIERSLPPEEQATFYTSAVAKVMSKALGGILTPTEIEALAGGYTAGAATSAMQVLDEISGLKDHPGIAANPLGRFSKQQVHGQSSYVDQLYELSLKLDQGEATASMMDQQLKRRIDSAKRQISSLRKSYREGSLSQAEAERRSYEIARPLVEQQKR